MKGQEENAGCISPFFPPLVRDGNTAGAGSPEVLLFQTQCPDRRVGMCGAQASSVTAGSACGPLCREKLWCSLSFQLQASGNRETFIMRNVPRKEQQHFKKKTSPVPLCDSKIFREICALYAVGILEQGIGTSIIQKLKQDVWKRQIDSWFVPNLWLYVIHHCQA